MGLDQSTQMAPKSRYRDAEDHRPKSTQMAPKSRYRDAEDHRPKPIQRKPMCACAAAGDWLPLHAFDAASNGHVFEVREFLKLGHPNATYKGQTLLHAACSNGRENVVSFLLKLPQTCINLPNYYNETAYMLAASGGHVGCLMLLSRSSAKACKLEIDNKNDTGRTALDLASTNNHNYAVTFLTIQKEVNDTSGLPAVLESFFPPDSNVGPRRVL